MNKIESALQWGREWQCDGGADLLQHHTLGSVQATRIAAGYMAVLRYITGRRVMSSLRGLGIGSGAGHLEAALDQLGLQMTASEWNEDGVALLAREVPSIPRRLIDLASFADREAWDVIVCRELYPFTRVDDYPAQMELIARMLSALRCGGALLLVGSDVNAEGHLDYDGMRRDLRAAGYGVRRPLLELVVKRTASLPHAVTIALNITVEAALLVRNSLRRPPIASIRIYVIHKP